MNRYPMGKPPKWWSPKPSPFWMALWRPMRRYQQIHRERIGKIEVCGLHHVRAAMQQDHGVLITANHPAHADCFLLFEALGRLRRRCYVMTTWQVFQMAGPIERWQYRQHGCFSVDRDGADRRAFRFSVDVLSGSSDPLVIFPEGEVYHLNQRVTPFREGPAAIAIAAARRSGRCVSCIPCALKYEYVKDPTPQLEKVMKRLEAVLGWPPQRHHPLAARVDRFGQAILQRIEEQYLGQAQRGSLQQRIEKLAHFILDRVARNYACGASAGDIPQRVKRLRQCAIGRRDALPKDDPCRAQIKLDLEDVFLALQLYSYPADYLGDQPSIEQVAETIDKLEEDVLRVKTASIRGRRRATIEFGAPMVVDHHGDRGAVAQLTLRMRDEVQLLVDGDQPSPSSPRSRDQVEALV